MKAEYINWDTSWNNCYHILPKANKMKWCNTCREYHDIGCFFRFKGHWLYCSVDKGNRGKSMSKIKGSVKK